TSCLFPWRTAARAAPSFPTRRSSDLGRMDGSRLLRCPTHNCAPKPYGSLDGIKPGMLLPVLTVVPGTITIPRVGTKTPLTWLTRSEEHTSELQSLAYLVCRLLLEKKH